MSSDSSSSFVQSPAPMNMSTEGGQSARSRNAQAQADLRARRKAYIAELQSSNANLDSENKVLQREKQTMQEQINTLRGQVRTLKHSLGMAGGRGSNGSAVGIDSLLTAVEAERKKVHKMRDAIQKLAMMDDALASDNESEREGLASRRKRRALSPSLGTSASPPALVGSIDLDQKSSPSRFETDSTVTTLSSLSPATPLMGVVPEATTTATTSSTMYWPSVPLAHRGSEADVGTCSDDSSQSALNLLLAQSSHFKQQVIQALTEDARLNQHHPFQQRHHHQPSFQPEEPLASCWHDWPHSTATSKSTLLPKATRPARSQDDVLDRFLSAFSGPSTTAAVSGSKVSDSPAKGHPHSASVFLVLLTCLLGRVIEWWE